MDKPKIIPREVHFAIHGVCAFAAVIGLSFGIVPMVFYPGISPVWLAGLFIIGIALYLYITGVLDLLIEPWADRKIAAANPGFVKKPQITRQGLPMAVDRVFWLIWSFASTCALAVGLSVLLLWSPGEPTGLKEILAITSAAVTYLAISKGIWRLVKPWARVKIEEAKLALATQ